MIRLVNFYHPIHIFRQYYCTSVPPHSLIILTTLFEVITKFTNQPTLVFTVLTSQLFTCHKFRSTYFILILKHEKMEKYMTEEEKNRAKERHKAELQELKYELSTLKPGRAVYIDQLGQSNAGNVFFKTSNDLTQLKSNVEKELRKHT
jgi:hypothetical protein